MSSKDNIDIFGDNWKLLSEDEKAQAEKLAAQDSELNADLEFNRALSKVSAEELIGEPPTNDAAFLVSLREELETPAPKPVWSGFRMWLTAGAASVLLFAGIFFGGGQGGSVFFPNSSFSLSGSPESASTLDWYAGIDEIDELDESLIADYLGYGEDADILEFDYDDTDEPISDQLLALDAESVDGILNQIESLTFFDNHESAHEG